MVSGVNVFWWLAVAGPRCVGIVASLSASREKLDFTFRERAEGRMGRMLGCLRDSPGR